MPDFLSLWDAGYTDLIPVIPPDAKLSPYTKVDPGARGKSPGVLYDSGWGGFNWMDCEPTRELCQTWEHDGASVGLVCRRCVAFDIDVKDSEAVDAIQNVIQSRLGVTAVRVGNPPKTLLLYRLDDDEHEILAGGGVPWRQIRFTLPDDERVHALEVLGAGRQFVMQGVHPDTGSVYEWTEPLPSRFEDLPTVKADEINPVLDEIGELVEFVCDGEVLNGGTQTEGHADRAGVAQAQLRAEDLDELEQVCERIPNTSEIFPHRDDYIRVASAFKAAFADDELRGFEAWWRWCERWNETDDGDNSRERAWADWRRLYPPFGVGENYLYDLARQYGEYNAEAAAQAFTDLPAPPAEPSASRDDPGTSAPASSDPGDTGVAFFDHYVYVESVERFLDLRTKVPLTHSQFSVRWAGEVGDGSTGQKGANMVYLNHPRRRLFRAMTYRPRQGVVIDEAGDLCANTWRPGPAHGSWADNDDGEVNVDPYLELMHSLVPDEREREILLDWLAWQVQYPGAKCNWHPLLWGAQGVGKDTILVPIIEGLGRNAKTIQAEQLHNQWTDWLADKSLIVVEEINTFERRAIADSLKALLSTPPWTVAINGKHTPVYDMPNVANYVFLSNHPDAMVLEQADRRFFVLQSPAQPGELSEDFFTHLYQWFKHGGAEQVCRWLGRRDLSAFEAQGHAPVTSAKRHMQEQSLGVVEGTLKEAIDLEDGPFCRDLVSAVEIREYLQRHVPEQSKKLSPQRLGSTLSAFGLFSFDRVQVRDPDGPKRIRVWAVRRVAMYQDQWRKLGGLDGDQARAELRRMYTEQKQEAQAREAQRMMRTDA